MQEAQKALEASSQTVIEHDILDMCKRKVNKIDRRKLAQSILRDMKTASITLDMLHPALQGATQAAAAMRALT